MAARCQPTRKGRQDCRRPAGRPSVGRCPAARVARWCGPAAAGPAARPRARTRSRNPGSNRSHLDRSNRRHHVARRVRRNSPARSSHRDQRTRCGRCGCRDTGGRCTGRAPGSSLGQRSRWDRRACRARPYRANLCPGNPRPAGSAGQPQSTVSGYPPLADAPARLPRSTGSQSPPYSAGSG
jgi:hypothetical protein